MTTFRTLATVRHHGMDADRLRIHRAARPRPAVGRDAVDIRARGQEQRTRRRERGPGSSSCRAGPDFPGRDRSTKSGWLKRALDDYHVLLLDSRGNGRSSVVLPQTLARRGDARAQADYLMHFRADSIVRDAELIRRAAGRRRRAVERARPKLRRVLRRALPVAPSARPARGLHHRRPAAARPAAPTTTTATPTPRSRARRASSSRAIPHDRDAVRAHHGAPAPARRRAADRRPAHRSPLPAGRLHARDSTTAWRISTTCSRARSAPARTATN